MTYLIAILAVIGFITIWSVLAAFFAFGLFRLSQWQ
jgi:hypothetical protein